MKINVEIPNVTIELVKGMKDLTGWVPSEDLNNLSRDTELTNEALIQVENSRTPICTNLEFNLDVDAVVEVAHLAAKYNLTISDTIAAMIIQIVLDKLSQDKVEGGVQ